MQLRRIRPSQLQRYDNFLFRHKKNSLQAALRSGCTGLSLFPFVHKREQAIGANKLIFYHEIVQQGFVMVLGGKAGVTKIAVGVAPVLNAAVVV